MVYWSGELLVVGDGCKVDVDRSLLKSREEIRRQSRPPIRMPLTHQVLLCKAGNSRAGLVSNLPITIMPKLMRLSEFHSVSSLNYTKPGKTLSSCISHFTRTIDPCGIR